MPIENCPVKSRKRNITNECSCTNFATEKAEPNRSSIEMARAISHTGVPLPNNVIVENSQFPITRRRPNAKLQTISPKQTIPHQRDSSIDRLPVTRHLGPIRGQSGDRQRSADQRTRGTGWPEIDRRSAARRNEKARIPRGHR